MADHPTQTTPTDEVDFETAVADPAAFYAEPELISADDELSAGQKRRFLTEWAQDIEARQAAADEGMGAQDHAEPSADAVRLQRIRDGLSRLPEADGDPAGESTVSRLWRRLTQG